MASSASYHASYPIVHEPAFRAQYSEVISKPSPTAEELLRLDSSRIEPCKASIAPYFAQGTPVPSRVRTVRGLGQMLYEE